MNYLRSEIDPIVVCPRDRSALRDEVDFLVCEFGHRYRIVEGIPILLVSEAQQTHIEGTRALAIAETGDLSQLRKIELGPGEIDPFVKKRNRGNEWRLVSTPGWHSNGLPNPRTSIAPGNGKLFVEFGCNWAVGVLRPLAQDIVRSGLILL